MHLVPCADTAGEPLQVPAVPLWWLSFVVLLFMFGQYLASTGLLGGLWGEGQHGVGS